MSKSEIREKIKQKAIVAILIEKGLPTNIECVMLSDVFKVLEGCVVVDKQKIQELASFVKRKKFVIYLFLIEII